MGNERGTRRIGVFGWGVVAPKAPDVDTFAARLESPGSWLNAFDGFGPSNFLTGTPAFDFEAYEPWVSERFPPNRFPALNKKMGYPTQYAIGAFIQSLSQNAGLEAALRDAGLRTQVIVGGGLHDLPTYYDASLAYARTQRRWDRFWSTPQNNSALEEYLADRVAPSDDLPPDPETLPVDERDEAEDRWWHYWAARSPQLDEYLTELRAIESLSVEGDVESGKASLIRRKAAAVAALRKKWKSPEPPWNGVTSNVLWNIGNTPASQISMMGQLTGMCYAPFAACSTFGYSLRLGMRAITHGEADFAVIGATDPPPHPMSVGTFYNARVLSADGELSKPLTGLRGTHVAGGACVWIIGDLEHGRRLGFEALGMEPIAVGVSADADHIITPSVEGPTSAIRAAFDEGGISPEAITHWDLHATATPGDYLEVETIRKVIGDRAVLSARKGTFGHGMGAGGGWELTAQYLAAKSGVIPPTTLTPAELNPEIGRIHANFVFDHACRFPDDRIGCVGKLSMGVGGINACVISRPYDA
ncbi:MAG: beta-ketoacyl synthase [Planctomycetes bacterium]|nr:beta-ketoacyl synthase [Planctomycetota bacterium]